jgi:hypothetical protein
MKTYASDIYEATGFGKTESVEALKFTQENSGR